MLIKKITKRALLSLAVSQLIVSASGMAKPVNERDFKTQPLGHGVYEMAFVKDRNALFVASSPSFDKDKTSGLVFQLAADSLHVDTRIPTTRRTFSVALDEANHLLYLGNALDGSVTLLDSQTGKELRTIQLSDDAVPEKKAHVREVVLDKKHHRLYVSGIGGKDKGLLWVVDTQKQQLVKTLDNMEPVGFAVDEAGNKVYAVTGKGEILTLDGLSSDLISKVKVDPAETNHYFLNIALNTQKGIGYIADTNTRDVLVVQLDSGKLLHRISTPNSIAVLYNAARDEIYVTHRNARQISIIDAGTYRIKHTIDTSAMPNSLVLSPDARTLYVSVKQDEKSDQNDYVLKIDLTQL
ncbi:YncE family protein [Candidatus Pantoea formicae]|uniref:7-bladed beta-propeller protein YncE n=1 Tax=Candidatus Pantoea formicae TaxID=2608355 RepID=UPI003EDA6233